MSAASSNPAPLPELLRPHELDELLGLNRLDRQFVRTIREASGRPPTAILWGPPGSGKTTIARIIGARFNCEFRELSAVLAGVKDIRDVVQETKDRDCPTLVFIDEIHRFNKAQQDALLPHVENGTISLIGATTENPSFYLTGALLSRCRVVRFEPLDEGELRTLAGRASTRLKVRIDDDAIPLLAAASNGDGRRLVTLIEQVSTETKADRVISSALLKDSFKDLSAIVYDRSGDNHYDFASAFIKSMRGSDADAALYYGFRMLEAGEDPRFLIRRMVIFASEDISNADPRALQVAVDTLQAFTLVGLPEGRIPIAQCITYLATAPKSNRSYVAMHRVLKLIQDYPAAAVPKHLRNAPTQLMKSMGHGEGYEYPHDTGEGFAKGVRYLPEELRTGPLYEPSDRGYEKNIGERLEWLKRKG